jgi:hypothetical protein
VIKFGVRKDAHHKFKLFFFYQEFTVKFEFDLIIK